jgi:DNA-binding CsgD family transcriptional regulator
MDISLKEKVLKLRGENKTYDEIKDLLGCSKATISYHCTRNGLGDNRVKINDELISKINEYYKSHTIDEVADKFNIARSTVICYVENKRVKLTDDERNHKNYERVKSRRQQLKQLAVDYKGGKCNNCGYDKSIWAFDFHHINPEKKDFSISRYLTLSWNKIKDELDKCIMLCANCHRELHHNEYKKSEGRWFESS